MKIAMLGTRGVPASYSGFETCAEQLGARLVERGHQVAVYCRSHHIAYSGRDYRGMRLIRFPSIRNKYLDTITHTLVSSLHVLRCDYDVALYFIVGNSPLLAVPRLRGLKTIINVDGLDWKREKWPGPAKAYLRWSEGVATRLADAVITDSQSIQEYYRRRYRRETTYIPYGSEIEPQAPGAALARYGLSPRQYVLFVGRLVPENCINHLVDAFRDLKTDMRCVIVGDAPYADGYINQLMGATDPRVIFTGYQFGEPYRELLSNAYAFVETSGAGGTHPALVEAMAVGNCVVANGTAENRETIGSDGFAYDGRIGPAALRDVLATLIDSPDIVAKYGARAAAMAAERYSWDRVTTEYERLFERLLAGTARVPD